MLCFLPPLQRQKTGRAISFLLSNFILWVDFKRGASRLPERRISAKHISVYAHHKALLFFFCLFSPPALCSRLKLSSAHSLCLCHSRCGRRRHVLGVALHVPGGVADGARGSGGAAGELRDLLQGQGDRLQGESREASRRPGRGLTSYFVYWLMAQLSAQSHSAVHNMLCCDAM